MFTIQNPFYETRKILSWTQYSHNSFNALFSFTMVSLLFCLVPRSCCESRRSTLQFFKLPTWTTIIGIVLFCVYRHSAIKNCSFIFLCVYARQTVSVCYFLPGLCLMSKLYCPVFSIYLATKPSGSLTLFLFLGSLFLGEICSNSFQRSIRS